MFSTMKLNALELNLLVVDDDDQVARVVKRTLGNKWKSISLAYSVDEALEILKHKDVDAILSDWDCPHQGNGVQIAQSTDLPLVIQTGNAGVNCPGVEVLNKPVDMLDAHDALVEALLKGRRKR